MTDTEGETMGTSESITEALRSVTANRGVILVEAYAPAVVMSESQRNAIADRIDERFSRELTAKQEEVDVLQAKLDASTPLPLDADGVVIGLGDIVKDGEDAIGVEELDLSAMGWRVWLDDWGDSVSPSDLTHVIPTPKPEGIEDVRRTVGRGHTYRDQDVLCAIDRAYACGRRDGAGERA